MSLLALNMMEIRENRKWCVNKWWLALIVAIALAGWLAPKIPNLSFDADCRNVPGGDRCKIRFEQEV